MLSFQGLCRSGRQSPRQRSSRRPGGIAHARLDIGTIDRYKDEISGHVKSLNLLDLMLRDDNPFLGTINISMLSNSKTISPVRVSRRPLLCNNGAYHA